MARLNGGIIGKKNTTSFGKNTVTSRTSSTPSAVTTQPGTRLVNAIVVAGGGGGGGIVGGGGGAGGVRCLTNISVCGNAESPWLNPILPPLAADCAYVIAISSGEYFLDATVGKKFILAASPCF